jgi:hypothetical protein
MPPWYDICPHCGIELLVSSTYAGDGTTPIQGQRKTKVSLAISICLGCGERFRRRRGRNFYCSRACRIRASARRAREKMGPPQERIIQCRGCGTEVRTTRKDQRWCSKKCQTRFYNRQLWERRRTLIQKARQLA